jgi:hypothetical protein
MTHTIEPYVTSEDRYTGLRLTITDEQDDSVVRIANNEYGIGIRTAKSLSGLYDDTVVVRVIGEDLTALRDLILSMPESAFPKPPPPPYVSPYGWAEGDIVVYGSDPRVVYVRDEGGAWLSYWDQIEGPVRRVSDKGIDKMISQATHVAARQGGRFQ